MQKSEEAASTDLDTPDLASGAKQIKHEESKTSGFGNFLVTFCLHKK